MVNRPEIIIFGAAILDIPAGPVDTSLLTAGSVPADRITMNTGGDALNEATVLAKLGKPVRHSKAPVSSALRVSLYFRGSAEQNWPPSSAMQRQAAWFYARI